MQSPLEDAPAGPAVCHSEQSTRGGAVVGGGGALAYDRVQGHGRSGRHPEAGRPPVWDKVADRVQAVLTGVGTVEGRQAAADGDAATRAAGGRGTRVGVTVVKDAVVERQRREVFVPVTYRPGKLAEDGPQRSAPRRTGDSAGDRRGGAQPATRGDTMRPCDAPTCADLRPPRGNHPPFGGRLLSLLGSVAATKHARIASRPRRRVRRPHAVRRSYRGGRRSEDLRGCRVDVVTARGSSLACAR